MYEEEVDDDDGATFTTESVSGQIKDQVGGRKKKEEEKMMKRKMRRWRKKDWKEKEGKREAGSLAGSSEGCLAMYLYLSLS